MRVVLLILLFVLWQVAAGGPASRPDHGAVWFGLGYAALVIVTRVWAGRVARVADADEYDHLYRPIGRFNVGMELARWAVPAWFAIGLFGLGWRRAVDGWLTRHGVPVAWVVTPGVVIGLLPPVAAWAGLWWSQYPVDRAARDRGGLVQLEAGLPVFGPPTFGRYMAHRLRVQVLFTVVPVVMILAARDGAMAAVRRAGVMSDAVDSVVSVATAVAVLVIAPAVLRHVLSTRPLPAGRLRDRLAEVLSAAGVRCRAVLLWDTHHNVGNAAVMGLIPPVRYVLFSDLLVECMTDEQLQAVFAHELGHVSHRHLAWLVGVLGTFVAALGVGGDWLADRLSPADSAGWAAAIDGGVIVASLAVAWVAYGTLSRWFERQADVYAVRLMDQLHPATGAVTVAAALRRVAVVNDIPLSARNWTHGTMATRIGYLYRLAADPAVGWRFDRAGRRVRACLWVTMILCGAVAAAGAF